MAIIYDRNRDDYVYHYDTVSSGGGTEVLNDGLNITQGVLLEPETYLIYLHDYIYPGNITADQRDND